MKKPVFRIVKQPGANIGSNLAACKSIALGNKNGKMIPCHLHGNCKCCEMMPQVSTTKINGRPVSCSPGTCKTKNCTYLVTCLICKKPYIGRTVQFVNRRIAGHRGCYKKVLISGEENIDLSKDDFSLGIHLIHEHGVTNLEDFDKN